MHRLYFLILAVVVVFPVFPAYAACTGPDGVPGDVMYNSDYDAFQGCTTGAGWVAFHQPVSVLVPDPPSGPTGCPNVGDQCDDDTYYAGDLDGVDIYVSAAAYQVSRTWNNGTTNWSATGMDFCNTSPYTAPSCVDGESNTDLLVGLSDAGAPYQAASYCAGLDAHGYDEGWYLPSRAELNLLWNNGSPIAGVVTSGSWYWSSSENNSSLAWLQRFSDAIRTTRDKDTSRLVRCVRR